MTKTPKEYAKDLVDSYIEIMPPLANQTANSIMAFAKESAKIAVDEILSLGFFVGGNISDTFYSYFEEVKSEIEQLIN